MTSRENLPHLIKQIAEAEKLAIAGATSSESFCSLVGKVRHRVRAELEITRTPDDPEPRNGFYIAFNETTTGITPSTSSAEWVVRLERAFEAVKQELAKRGCDKPNFTEGHLP